MKYTQVMMNGFVILELMVSMVIAGFIATSLLMTIVQINRAQQTMTTITSIESRIAILQNQMERDVMAAFIPAQVDMVSTGTVKKEQPKKLEKIFYGTRQKNDMFELLTFITASPLAIFAEHPKKSSKPHVARVVYRLIPDKKRKNSYNLMRQEGTTSLFFKAYSSEAQGELRPFLMIDAIRDMRIEYVTIQQKKSAEKKETLTYKKSFTWQSEQKNKPIALPYRVNVMIELWDSIFERSRTFHLTIPIMNKMGRFEQVNDQKDKSKALVSPDNQTK